MRIILLGLSLLAVAVNVHGELEVLKKALEAKRNPQLTDKVEKAAIYQDIVPQRVDNFNWQNTDTYYQV